MTKKKEKVPAISSVGNKNCALAVETNSHARPYEFPEGSTASFEPVPCYDYNCVVVRNEAGEIIAVFRGGTVANVRSPHTRLR